MGCHYCNDRVGGRRDDRRDDRRCCDWDKFLFGDRRRCDRRDDVLGVDDNRRRCRRRRDDDVLGAEDNRRRRRRRKCGCDFF
ncbi:hypothetical protein [Rossellomorea aquimaris]|uniref:hypothetical protein n=1 Tax=Rossellomorea aquimaris TaxID=189382 RepID=UPI000AF99714|nr:hypothetical protein [Rossellomorea aquimaris]